jgi:hypothetical protein
VHIAAAEWIKPLPCSRGSGICMADKLLLLVMWGYAPYTLRAHATGKQVYPSRRMLAEETGQTLDAVRDQLRRLLAAGWIRIDGEGWALAWVTPFETRLIRGHIYAIEISNGVVKVGRSGEPAARIATHAGHAEDVGLHVTRQWSSAELPDSVSAEAKLLEYMRAQCVISFGRERFNGGFDLAVEFGAGFV